MPQIDKVTFFAAVYWIFIFYFFLYFDLNVNYLYKLVTCLKLNVRRLSLMCRKVQVLNISTKYLCTIGV